MNKELAIQLLLLAVQFGPKMVLDIVNAWDKENITAEDIEKLKTLIKKPEEY
jgi:hypothetical protein